MSETLVTFFKELFKKQKIHFILLKKTQYTRYHIAVSRVLHTLSVFFKKQPFYKIVVFVFVVLCGIPLSTEASVISALFTGVKASSNYKSETNTQTMQLPNPEYKMTELKDKDTVLPNTNYTQVFLEEGVLASEMGPLGTDASVDENNKEDTASVYTVKRGDTVSKIAKLFDVSENTIRWANDLKKTQQPKEGSRIVILPVSGVSYVVKKGDTLKSISKKYKADPEEVGKFNGYELDSELGFGETLIIPNGEITEKKETPEKKKKKNVLVVGATKLIKGWSGQDTGGYYIRPVPGGIRTQGLHGRNGVDIGAATGTPVYAAASGTAIIAREEGYNGGYGKYVIISHGNGTQTIYGHLSEVSISEGSSVNQGQQIGAVGSTGKSTGPHLHWEVRGAKNPLGDNPKYGL